MAAKSYTSSSHTLKQAAKATVDKNLKAGAKTMSQGVGESKRFNAPEGTFPSKAERMQGTHVNGALLPESCYDTFPYALTDEGKAEAAAIQRSLPQQYTGRDRTDYSQIFDDDKKIDRFRDLRRESMEDDLDGLVIARDPMAPLVEKFTPPGHRGLFMSPKKCAAVGMVRGVLEYAPVMVPDPDNPGKLKQVTCGGMFLASVPIEVAERAERYYRRINNEKQVAAVEKVREQAAQIMTDGKLDDFARRRGASDTMVGLEDEDQERGDLEMARELQLREPVAHE